MVYSFMVFACRKAGVSHNEFKLRYEQHIKLVEDICGDAMPLRHTRTYIARNDEDQPIMLMGNIEQLNYDVVAQLYFENEAMAQQFYGALATENAKNRIDADEADFWDRTTMNVVVVGEINEWKK